MNRLTMLEWWGGLLFGRDVEHDWVKVSLMASELGVSVKTLYNWIEVGKLVMPRPGYVSQMDAYEVWLQQKNLRIEISYFQSKGITRDGYGRFQKSAGEVEQSGE